MKFAILLCLIFYVVAALAEPFACRRRPCNRKYMPICGERVVDDEVEKKTFANSCMMEAANDCGAGYKLCTLQEEDEE